MRRPYLATFVFLSLASSSLAQQLSLTGSQMWAGYGANGQHTANFTGSSQAVKAIHWQASLDDDRNYYGGEVLIHYASPAVSQYNTIVHAYRSTTVKNGTADFDHWDIVGRSGINGSLLWDIPTDYSAAVIFPNDWTSVFPMTLTTIRQTGGGGFSIHPVTSGTTGVVAAGAGGSILVKASADSYSEAVNRIIFYTTLKDFNANATAYSPVKINTPLTSDSVGNIYFGYVVTGTVPANLSSLGTGGIAKVNVSTGGTAFKSIQSMGIAGGLTAPAMNSAPAITADGSSVYVALTGNSAVLAKLDSTSLTPTAHVQLFDPSVPNGPASLISESSAAPMVGPDGHVFMGVFGYFWRESHGFMLQFDGNLKQTDSTGKQFPVGAFGWDDTPSVVPASIVPSYKGKGTYLILCKYNNYDDNGGDAGADGSNKVAVIDPSSNAITKDRQTGIPVMNEVISVLSPTLTNNDSAHPNARNEWCINSAAIDIAKKSAIVNCEDGRVYRWNFVTNTLSEALSLAPATGEAYTSTIIGPDGTIYAINNSILFAIGN